MKKVLPIIFLLLLLFLIPLFKSNYTDEYFCNSSYNLNNVTVGERYNCEGDFFDKYGRDQDDGGLITANGGTASECFNTIISLLNKLDLFFRIKQQIPDTSVCELAVAQDKIENLTNIIKMKLLSINSCEISYEQHGELQGILLDLQVAGNIDANVLSDIEYYALRHSVQEGEELRLQQKIDRADICLGYNREDVFQNNITECTIKGSQGPGGSQANILGLPNYSTTPIQYTLDVNDLLI